MAAGTGTQERMLSELGRLKARAGMSFTHLQSAVPYSRSALHRYFTGRSPIPRDALVAVVRACGGDEAAMVRMWEAAQADPALGADTPFPPSAPAPPVGPVGPVGPTAPVGVGASRFGSGEFAEHHTGATDLAEATATGHRRGRSAQVTTDGSLVRTTPSVTIVRA